MLSDRGNDFNCEYDDNDSSKTAIIAPSMQTKRQHKIKDRMNNAISFEKFYLNCIFIAHTQRSSGSAQVFKRNT